jgi:hypothetical protein
MGDHMDNPEREKLYTSYHAMVENVSRLRRLWGFALGVLGVGLLVLTKPSSVPQATARRVMAARAAISER